MIVSFAMVVTATDTYTEYKHLGHSQYNDYWDGVFGNWNYATTGEAEVTKYIDDQYFKSIPKTAILDDGEKYIIAYSYPNINLYSWNGASLNVRDGYTIENATNYLDGDFIIADIDNKTSIIYTTKNTNTLTAGTDLYIHFLHYNSTGFTRTTQLLSNASSLKWCTYRFSKFYNAFSINYTGCPTVVSCLESEDMCVAVYQTGYNGYTIASFNTSGIADRYLLNMVLGYDVGVVTLPDMATIIYAEIGDGDNTEDIIFSFKYADGGTFGVRVYGFDISATDQITADGSLIVTNAKGQTMCRDKAGSVYDVNLCTLEFTSVMASPFDGIPGNGQELFIGALSAADDYRIYQLSSSLLLTDTHPKTSLLGFFTVGEIEGETISNLFRTDCYSQSGATDIGVMTYNRATGNIEYLCFTSSEFGGSHPDCEFDHYPINFTSVSKYGYGKLVHPIETDATLRDEILTTWGIIQVEVPDFLISDCYVNIYKMYNFSDRGSSSYPIDYESTERADILRFDRSSFRYLDDGFSNRNANISDIIFNPCTIEDGSITQWAFNETIHVSVTGIDPNNNDVQTRVILYYNTLYAVDSGWSVFTPSGYDIDVAMIPNKTIGIATARVFLRDPYHSDYVYSDTFFSVGIGNDTVHFGDCISHAVLTPTATPETLTNNTVDINDNVITNTIKQLSTPTGLSITIIYIIFMVIVALVILFADIEIGQKFYLILFIEVLFTIVGVKLAIFGVGTMIVLIILLLLGGLSAVFTAISGGSK
jgi:hypothetical protein